jgi:hypothetical protein
MNSSFSLPPVQDPALITQAAALLAALSDVKATKVRLGQLADATEALIQARSDHDAAKAGAETAAAKLSSLQADAVALADAQAAHERNATALAVASEANAERSRALDLKERAAIDRERAIAAREAAFVDRVSALKQQLA